MQKIIFPKEKNKKPNKNESRSQDKKEKLKTEDLRDNIDKILISYQKLISIQQ